MEISMCVQRDCPKATECYLVLATPDEYRQSYMQPEFDENGCKHFWQVKEEAKKKDKK